MKKQIRNSRVNNAMLNSVLGVFSFVIILVMNLVTRRIFALYLGEEYLGLSSVFTNIISMLSLSELGIGSAIIIFLYSPIVNNDKEKIKTYMRFYCNMYRIIAFIITALGVIVFFLLPYIIKTSIKLKEVQFYFALYLFNTVVSYLMAYRKSLLYADQRNGLVSISHMISKVAVAVMQIALLYIFKSFIYFVIPMIIGTIVENLFVYIYVGKNYSYIKEKNVTPITKDDKKAIWTKILPLLVQNIAIFLIDSTDNIVLSAFIGVGLVGIYSNYILVINTFSGVFSQISGPFTVGFGNMAVNGDEEHCEDIYSKFMFLTFWVAAFLAFGYICCIQPFIKAWLGDGYVYSMWMPILLICSFVLKIFSVPGISVQNAMGLHSKDIWFVVVQGVMNIILSIILVQYIGVYGVILGTIICRLTTTFYSKEIVLYKYLFKKSPAKMILTKIFYLAIIALLCVGGYYLFAMQWISNIYGELIVKIIVSAISINVILCCLFFKSKYFRYFKALAFRIIKKIFARRNNANNNIDDNMIDESCN